MASSDEIDERFGSSLEKNNSVPDSDRELNEDRSIEQVRRDRISFDDLIYNNVGEMGADKIRSITPPLQDLQCAMSVEELSCNFGKQPVRNKTRSSNKSFSVDQNIYQTYDKFFEGIEFKKTSEDRVRKKRKLVKVFDKYKSLPSSHIRSQRLNRKCHLRCNNPLEDIVDLSQNYLDLTKEPSRVDLRKANHKLISLIKRNFRMSQKEVDKNLFMEADCNEENLLKEFNQSENMNEVIDSSMGDIYNNDVNQTTRELSKSSSDGFDSHADKVEHDRQSHTPTTSPLNNTIMLRSMDRNQSRNFILSTPNLRKRRTKNYVYASNSSHGKYRHLYLLVPNEITSVENLLILDNYKMLEEYLSGSDEDDSQGSFIGNYTTSSEWDPEHVLMKLNQLWHSKGSFVTMDDVFKLGNLGSEPAKAIGKALQSLASKCL